MEKKTLFEQAKGAKSAEELMSLAKGAGIDMDEENAKQLFGRLHQSGELADEELDSVAGGGCKTEEKREFGYIGRRFTVKPGSYYPTACSCGGKTYVVTDEGYNTIIFYSGFGVKATCEQCGASERAFDITEINFV